MTITSDPEHRCARIAQAAATGLMTHLDVDDAVVRIDGPHRAPRLRIECLLAPEGDVSRTTELVVSVRDHLEAMLDLTFDTAEMTIRNVAERRQDGTGRPGAPPTPARGRGGS